MKKRDFKVVVIGDSGVGKSTFISALINESLNKVTHVNQHQPIQLPPEMFNHPECNTTLIDTKCQPNQIPEQVKIADVILLMYSIDDDGSCERLKKFWLKELKEKEFKQPIIIVGNKLDLMGVEDDRDYCRIFKVIKQLVKDFSQVEMGIECSSIKFQGIQDVINCAQRSYLYPLAPLYSLVNKTITEGFKKALTRIFRICDRDGDGVWSDQELERFQKKVFKRHLDQSDIAGIKDMIEEELKDDSNKKNYITLQGFMTLQKRGIELMKVQISWTILRFFYYKDDLTLDESLFQDELIFDQEAGQTVELSDIAQQKLKSIFQQFGQTLTQAQFDYIFYPVMYQTSFPLLQQYHPQSQDINLTQWLALWNAFSFFNYKDAYKLLSYIGIDIKMSDAFKEQNKKDSWSSVQKIIERRVFHIAIITKNKQKILEGQFNNISPRITTINSKTYVISIYDELQAEQQIEKRRLSIIDFLMIEPSCSFQTVQLIPITFFYDKISVWNQVYKIIEVLNSQQNIILLLRTFGYSEVQIQQLKQKNSFSIISFTSGIVVLIGLISGGYYYFRYKPFKKTK
ncbi:unnamed protein product [Paramecium pentaurelia]|uniref:EF hand associated type-2 domain-containing protein n=1 Tax=Paramecium pentaurelia TaxID=43138 RepID=A0A8S1SD86_9CILI|nr:unnamed protein product [Paramecium pentaurelia]